MFDDLAKASGDLDRLLARLQRHGRLQHHHDEDVGEAERIGRAVMRAGRQVTR